MRTALALAFMIAAIPGRAGAGSETRETALVRAVQQCRKSVVNIHTERVATDDKESRFFSQKSRKVSGMGTGIIVDERGYVVTNYHVIEDVDKIIVTMEAGETFEARPVSFDRKQDLAIIRIDSREPLTVMAMGSSGDLMLAETVFAVGNAYGYEHTITSGIISALHRDVEVDETQSYQNLIQTDASINPGNSGGPLLNLDGEVIGINVAIRAGAQRIGFAIPIDDARRAVARLLSVERLNGIGHGLTTTDVKLPKNHQLRIEKVAPGSASDQCGLQPGDIIRTVRGLTIHDGTDFERSLLDLPVGKVVDVVLTRDGRDQTLQYTVGVGKPGAAPVLSVSQAAVSPTAGGATGNGEKQTAAATGGTQVPSVPPEAASESDKANSAVDPILTRTWDLLGLRLNAMDERDRQQIRGRYEGGMKVGSVRTGSAAARHGIRAGDILVGLDNYQTLGPENLRYILSDERLQAMTQLSFQIVRSGAPQPLQGSMDLRVARR